MKREDFAVLNQNMGQVVVNTGVYNWIVQNNRTAISCPPELPAFPTQAEIDHLFGQGMRAISFRTEIEEKNFFEYLFQGSSYLMEDFDRKVRNRIKKGLNSCVVTIPGLNDLIGDGLRINRQTTDRQNIDVQMLTDKERWEKCITALYNARDVHIKGAYIEGVLVAYAVFIKVEEKYYIYYPYMDRHCSAYCPINAIFFTFINERIEEEGTIKISAGLSSYIEKKDLDRFKTNMLFEMVPCSRVLAISPRIAPLINSFGSLLLQKATALHIVNPELLTQYRILLNSKGLYGLYLNEHFKNVPFSSEHNMNLD